MGVLVGEAGKGGRTNFITAYHKAEQDRLLMIFSLRQIQLYLTQAENTVGFSACVKYS